MRCSELFTKYAIGKNRQGRATPYDLSNTHHCGAGGAFLGWCSMAFFLELISFRFCLIVRKKKLYPLNSENKTACSQENIICIVSTFWRPGLSKRNTAKNRNPAWVFIITYNPCDENNASGPNVDAKEYKHVRSHAACKLAEFWSNNCDNLCNRLFQAASMKLTAYRIYFSIPVALAGRLRPQCVAVTTVAVTRGVLLLYSPTYWSGIQSHTRPPPPPPLPFPSRRVHTQEWRMLKKKHLPALFLPGRCRANRNWSIPVLHSTVVELIVLICLASVP